MIGRKSLEAFHCQDTCYPRLLKGKELSHVIVQPRKIRPQAKTHNFAFKNCNIAIEGIIQERKDYFLFLKNRNIEK